MKMPHLFETTSINGMDLNNRFVRSATWEGMAGEDGSATDRLADVMVRLARGGLGLIISGHTFVSGEGRTGAWQLGAHEDRLIPGLTDMVSAVHEAEGKIAMQLTHAGAWAASHLTGLEPIGPSAIQGKTLHAREMTIDDIRQTILAFAHAAFRVKAAGFDAVQLHGAHGYLINQFLSPYFNKRTDEYGGTIENRARFVADIVKAVRTVVGPDFPFLIKLNSEDFLPGGLTVDDMLDAAMILEEAGIDCIEMSGGTFLSGENSPSRKARPGHAGPEAYYEAAAKRYKERINIPLMLVGGVRTFGTAERLVGEGITDYIALCRPLIREPELIRRWKSGDTRPARCISDSGCFKPGFEGKGVCCVVESRRKG